MAELLRKLAKFSNPKHYNSEAKVPEDIKDYIHQKYNKKKTRKSRKIIVTKGGSTKRLVPFLEPRQVQMMRLNPHLGYRDVGAKFRYVTCAPPQKKCSNCDNFCHVHEDLCVHCASSINGASFLLIND